MDYSTFVKKGVRHNDKSNRTLFYLSARLAPRLAYALHRVGFSANNVTVLFFVLVSVVPVAFIAGTTYSIILGYLLYRVHVVLDVADGIIVRVDGSGSWRGAFLDYLCHVVTQPLVAFGCSYAILNVMGLSMTFSATMYVVGWVLIVSWDLGTKGAHARASIGRKENSRQMRAHIDVSKPLLRVFVNQAIGLEGLMLILLVLLVVTPPLGALKIILTLQIAIYLVKVLYKMVSIVRNGYYVGLN